MAVPQDILSKLPKNLHEIAQRFSIPEERSDHIELVQLVLESKSMDKDEEKQSWFNLLPVMSKDQIDKLYDILHREKEKLAQIEAKYEEKKSSIKAKYLARWQNMGYIKKINDIQEKEQAMREKEQEEADSLLEDL